MVVAGAGAVAVRPAASEARKTARIRTTRAVGARLLMAIL